ncbi:UPF0489 family protein [Bradyrhizobium sp. sBnM-33]|uniref:UPF0489 family protein n=1 Tax=Bradyrhizobium sp. sBnM-33 TaxID=2831780 RepID=UPI001BCCB1E0|nr:UPF0489 family protein [Bradyrhizobium sp. sBnM-33]WOH50682.1 UPF0489 family protein [Bradyrhizobium sp. sBnM-33]
MDTQASGEFLVPFRERNPSGAYNQNFLWKTGSIYVMDNHRAALWCWMKHVNPTTQHSILHIDRHYDTLRSNMGTWLLHYPKQWDVSIQEYLDLSFEDRLGQAQRLFRWDNYLSLYFENAKDSISTCCFATHGDGDRPELDQLEQVTPWALLQNLDYWVREFGSPWIINIDLDYFFCDDSEDDQIQMLSDQYVVGIFSAVRKSIDAGHVAVTTVALSPEFCGGWGNSERVLKLAVDVLGIDFSLPK